MKGRVRKPVAGGVNDKRYLLLGVAPWCVWEEWHKALCRTDPVEQRVTPLPSYTLHQALPEEPCPRLPVQISKLNTLIHQQHQYTASAGKSWSFLKRYISEPFPHFSLWTQLEVFLQVVLRHTICKEFSRNALSLNSTCKAMSPPSINPCNDLQHTLPQAFPELQLLWGKRASTPMSHQPLAAMKGTSMSVTNMSHYSPNATTMEILREQRAEKRQVQNVTLHSCHSVSLQPNNFDIYSIICKHLRWFISVTSGGFFVADQISIIVAHPIASSYPTALLWMGAIAAILRDASCPCYSLDLQGSLSFTSSVPGTNFWWAVRPLGSRAQPAGHSGFC